MRALSLRQAGRCEEAKGGRCRCRCGGQFHGMHRQPKAGGVGDDGFFHRLAESDPHHVPEPPKPKKRRRQLDLFAPVE